jgi:DNA-binding LytR/AlgR family response regulator
VYRTKARLYQLIDDLEGAGFVQVSKSCLLNINTLESVKNIMNSRMEAVLSNGYRININRKFIALVRSKLED